MDKNKLLETGAKEIFEWAKKYDELKAENMGLKQKLEEGKAYSHKLIDQFDTLSFEHDTIKAKAQRLVDTLGKANLFAQEQSENAEYPNVRRRASRLINDIDSVLEDWQNKEGV